MDALLVPFDRPRPHLCDLPLWEHPLYQFASRVGEVRVGQWIARGIVAVPKRKVRPSEQSDHPVEYAMDCGLHCWQN